MKLDNIHIVGILEGQESEQEIENLFEEIMAKNICNMVKEENTQVQEAQRVPNKLDPKRPILKMTRLKVKEEILKSPREKQVVT